MADMNGTKEVGANDAKQIKLGKPYKAYTDAQVNAKQVVVLGCGTPIRRGGWWACARCDYDVCPRCYAEHVEKEEEARREEEARVEAEAAAAGQSVGLQEEDPLGSAGGLDPEGGRAM